MHSDDCYFHYRGFLLICDPAPLEGGGYRARAAIARYDGTGDTLVASSPEDVVLITEEAAVEYARAWAVDWIDANVPR